MIYKSHRVGGICAATITSAVMLGPVVRITGDTVAPILAITASALLGSVLPDIDHPNSYVSRKNPILSAITMCGLQISKAITQLILFFCFWIPKKRKNMILRGFEHRGIFHSLLMLILLFLLLKMIPGVYGSYISYGLCAGYLSHLLMDMLTRSGVRLFYPIINYSFHFPFIRLSTGNTRHEFIAKILFIIGTLAILVGFNGKFWMF